MTHCDILLFFATTSEKEQLQKAANDRGIDFKKTQGERLVYYDLGRIGTIRVMAHKCEMGPFSPNGSAARAIRASSETQATSIISMGMAFGVDRTLQEGGDVLVSEQLRPYDYKKVICNQQSHASSKDTPSGVSEDFSKTPSYLPKSFLLDLFKTQNQVFKTGRNYSVFFGSILSGGAMIHCDRYRDYLQAHLSKSGAPVIGGEMEGIGIISSTHSIEDPNWIIVKGISDFADSNREDEIIRFREPACFNSASFILDSLRNFNPQT
tara:strand:- start:3808 stop:4605 length:798 start_codon:yes stop_codon:yes gene_type:complete